MKIKINTDWEFLGYTKYYTKGQQWVTGVLDSIILFLTKLTN